MDGDQEVAEGLDGQGDESLVVAAQDDIPSFIESEMDDSSNKFPSNELVLQLLAQKNCL